MEYNVENLFDTICSPRTDDAAFSPQGEKRWNTPRYLKKLGMLARAIAAAGGDRPVDLVVLCEVENDSVVSDLIGKTSLRRLGYSYLMTHGRDVRGINVALLYRPLHFRPFCAESLRPFAEKDDRPMRDVLHVAGLAHSGDTLDIFGVHLPSRLGGLQAAKQRKRAARFLKAKADSVVQRRMRPRVVITGDFNDDISAKNLRHPLVETRDFVLVQPESATVGGTYKYKGEWNRLDHVLVNAEMAETSMISAKILTTDFLLEPDAANGGVKPRRTYQGPKYKGGVSDHLPLVVEFFP